MNYLRGDRSCQDPARDPALAGLYNITPYPVDAGVFHPAALKGLLSGLTLTLTVALSDTDVTLGSVLVALGKEPRMGPCPICRPRNDSPGMR